MAMEQPPEEPTSNDEELEKPPSPEIEPYRRPGRRRRRGPGRSFYDFNADKPQPLVAGLADGRPLIAAILSGDMMLAQGILLAGGDPNAARDYQGRLAIHLAAASGIPGLCRHLIKASAELDEVTAGGGAMTALHLAVLGGHTAVLKILLEAAANPNVANLRGETPLSLGVADGNTEAVRQLLKAKASTELLVDSGEGSPSKGGSTCSSPAHGAQATGGFSLQKAPQGPVSALYRAVEQNVERDMVADLIDAGAEMDVEDASKNQPIHVAITRAAPRVTRLLLERRANPECANIDLRTPLHCAATGGSTRVVRMLAENRADVNAEDRYGITPVQLAVDPTIEQQLYQLGARKGPGLTKVSSAPSILRQGPSRHGAVPASMAPGGEGGRLGTAGSAGSRSAHFGSSLPPVGGSGSPLQAQTPSPQRRPKTPGLPYGGTPPARGAARQRPSLSLSGSGHL